MDINQNEFSIFKGENVFSDLIPQYIPLAYSTAYHFVINIGKRRLFGFKAIYWMTL